MSRDVLAVGLVFSISIGCVTSESGPEKSALPFTVADGMVICEPGYESLLAHNVFFVYNTARCRMSYVELDDGTRAVHVEAIDPSLILEKLLHTDNVSTDAGVDCCLKLGCLGGSCVTLGMGCGCIPQDLCGDCTWNQVCVVPYNGDPHCEDMESPSGVDGGGPLTACVLVP